MGHSHPGCKTRQEDAEIYGECIPHVCAVGGMGKGRKIPTNSDIPILMAYHLALSTTEEEGGSLFGHVGKQQLFK